MRNRFGLPVEDRRWWQDWDDAIGVALLIVVASMAALWIASTIMEQGGGNWP